LPACCSSTPAFHKPPLRLFKASMSLNSTPPSIPSLCDARRAIHALLCLPRHVALALFFLSCSARISAGPCIQTGKLAGWSLGALLLLQYYCVTDQVRERRLIVQHHPPPHLPARTQPPCVSQPLFKHVLKPISLPTRPHSVIFLQTSPHSVLRPPTSRRRHSPTPDAAVAARRCGRAGINIGLGEEEEKKGLK